MGGSMGCLTTTCDDSYFVGLRRKRLRGISLAALFIIMHGTHHPEPLMAQNRPLIIAHRGASGFLPEHTLEAKAFAYAAGADYLEQDLVLTKDGIPIVIHDRHLDTTTNVKQLYPHRARQDGRFYAIDFTWDEIKRLTAHERIDVKTGQAVFPRRFPLKSGTFRLNTFQEEIDFIQGLNRSTGRNVGIYPEIKSPAWHRQQGHDISRIVLEILRKSGYTDTSDRCYLQCFDPRELRRIRKELGCRLRLIQLIGENSWHKDQAIDYDFLRTPQGLQSVADYADGIGPRIEHLAAVDPDTGRVQPTDLLRDAHAAGLKVHPYTLRIDALPKFAKDTNHACQVLFQDVGVDGIFTDFPGRIPTQSK